MPKKEKEVLEKNLKKKVAELQALYEIGKSLTSTLELEEVLRLIAKKVKSIMNVSSCSLRLMDDTKQLLVLKCAYGFDKKFYKAKKRLKIGESIAGRVVANNKPYIINDIRKERLYKYPHLNKQKGLFSLLSVPLVQKGKAIGVLSVYNKKADRYNNDDLNVLNMFASQASIAIENAIYYEQAKTGYLNTIKTLANIIDAKDNYTYGHSERVTKNCLLLADKFGLSEHDKEVLKYASLLHDVGKIGIDVGLLRKPSKLTEREWKAMAMHPVLGSGIVKQVGFLNELSPIILHHHERWDGKGYPDKLKGSDIPISARILSITDAYEAMVSDRPYRKALSLKAAKKELLNSSGSQFDPKMVKQFMAIIENKKKKK